MKYRFPVGYSRFKSFLVCDANNVIAVSDGFRDLTGYGGNEIIGRKISEVFVSLLRIPLKKLKKIEAGLSECYLFTRCLHPREVFIKQSVDKAKATTLYYFIDKPTCELDDRLILLGQLMNRSGSGYALFTVPDLILLKANQQYLDFLSPPFNRPENSIGKPMKAIVAGYEGSQTEAVWNTVIGTRKINHIGEKRHGAGNSATYWDSNITPVFEHGKMKYIYETATEVTERVHNRQLLKDQSENLQIAQQLKAEALESISDGFLSLNREWRFTYINRRAAEIFGYKPGELLGKVIWDVIPPALAQITGPHLREVMEERKPSSMEISGVFPDRFLNCNAYPSIDGISLYCVDMTNQKHSEMEIIRSKEKADILYEVAEKLLNHKPQEIIEELCRTVMHFLHCHVCFHYLVDDKKRILHLNASAGVDPEMVKALEWLEFGEGVCGCVVQEGCRVVAHDIQNSHDPRTVSLKLKGICAYACHPLTDQSNRVIGTLAFGTRTSNVFHPDDLAMMKAVAGHVAVAMNRIQTEQIVKEQHQFLVAAEKERNAALEKAIVMKDEFLSLISHEFKTPLAVINSALQAMEHICGHELSTKSRSFLAKIRQNSNRQLRLVNNLLDITRVQSDRIKLNKYNADIVFISRSITESVQLYAQQKELRLSFTSTMAKKIIAMDEEKYERILLNLLSNAIKFTPRGKSITVRLYVKNVEHKQKVCVSVEDHGLGIPVEKQGTIFERFGQVDNSLSRQAEGAGIGLYLAKMFTEAMEGQISVISEVGKGSTFTVLLPSVRLHEPSASLKKFSLNESGIIRSTEVEFSDIYF